MEWNGMGEKGMRESAASREGPCVRGEMGAGPKKKRREINQNTHATRPNTYTHDDRPKKHTYTGEHKLQTNKQRKNKQTRTHENR